MGRSNRSGWWVVASWPLRRVQYFSTLFQHFSHVWSETTYGTVKWHQVVGREFWWQTMKINWGVHNISCVCVRRSPLQNGISTVSVRCHGSEIWTLEYGQVGCFLKTRNYRDTYIQPCAISLHNNFSSDMLMPAGRECQAVFPPDLALLSVLVVLNGTLYTCILYEFGRFLALFSENPT